MILAIDQGTTGTTCLVVDDDLRVLGRGYRELEQRFPQPGWVEQDPEQIWSSVLEAVFAVFSLFAWTHAAAAAARRLPPLRVHTYLALVTSATMLVMTMAAAVWFVSVTADSPSFVGTAQLAVIATFMLVGNLVAAAGVRALHA